MRIELSRKRNVITLALAVLMPAGYLSAQPAEHTLAKLRALKLREAPGLVPVIYTPASEERALRWQRSLGAAHAWFQEQLHREVPVTLAVLDRETWRKVSTDALPRVETNPGLVMIPEHIEDVYPAAAKSIDPVLGVDAFTFHAAGLVFADALKLDGNFFVSDFFANLFVAGYIRAARPDLAFLLNGPPADVRTPRYTSGGDLNYLGTSVGGDSYVWMELQLQRLADFCLKGRSFASAVAELPAAFPAEHPRHVTNQEAISRLERLFPGSKAVAGPLGEPPTMTRVNPSACSEPPNQTAAASERRGIVVRNDTADPLDLTRSDGSRVHVNPYAWRGFLVAAGSTVRMSDGTCLSAGQKDDPVLAIITRQAAGQRQ